MGGNSETDHQLPSSDEPHRKGQQDSEDYDGLLRGGNHRDWDKWLPEFRFAINNAKHESTGRTPAELMMGRPLKGPLEIQAPTPSQPQHTLLERQRQIVSEVRRMGRGGPKQTSQIVQCPLEICAVSSGRCGLGEGSPPIQSLRLLFIKASTSMVRASTSDEKARVSELQG